MLHSASPLRSPAGSMGVQYLHLSHPDEKQAVAGRCMVLFSGGGRIDITYQCHMYNRRILTL